MQLLLSSIVFLCGTGCIFATVLPHNQPQFVPDLRIHGGGKAKPHEYPPAVWMQISSYEPNKTQSASLCGGTLISKDYVLTAAHCLQTNSNKLKHYVLLGVHDWAKDPKTDHQAIEVTSANFIIHPDYNPKKSYLADIGLIKLPTAAKIKPKQVEVAKLPAKADASKTYVNELCRAYGWGTLTDNGQASHILRYYESKVISDAECKRSIVTNPDNICTNGKDEAKKNVSVCEGDSGGPLVTSSGKVLIGVVSRSRECDQGHPSVFINVGKYLEWIKKNSNAVIN